MPVAGQGPEHDREFLPGTARGTVRPADRRAVPRAAGRLGRADLRRLRGQGAGRRLNGFPPGAEPRTAIRGSWRRPVRLRVPARRPGPELVGVEYRPDVLDLVACDVEGQHRHGDAVQLSDQAGPAVD